MYGGGCATGNCGVGACGTESVTYESPSTGETKKEPVAPEEMEPIRSRNENNTPPNTYSPPPEPGLPSGESDWEETDDFRRNDILGEDEPLPNPGSNNSPGLGIDPLPETEETFNPNLDGTEPAVEPMPPLDESTPAPADQPNNRLFDDNPFGTSTTPNTDSETERRVGRPEGPAPAETESTIPAEEAPDEETEATDESPAGAPLPMPEEIESETDELPSEDVAPENPASLENLRPTGLDSRISLNAPVRTRSGKATSSRVNIPEVVRKPSPQKTLTKNGNKPQRLVSR
ncbi:MAG: hypothetical protein CMJ46_10285 [Planctomyces sp.]|nr:hypothetical protein [Planctomyces sp.]